MKSLKQDPKGILPSGRWSAFNKDPKEQQHKNEDAVFSPIEGIFDKVVDTIVANSELTEASDLVQFLYEPDKPSTSSDKRNATRPDGYLVWKARVIC